MPRSPSEHDLLRNTRHDLAPLLFPPLRQTCSLSSFWLVSSRTQSRRSRIVRITGVETCSSDMGQWTSSMKQPQRTSFLRTSNIHWRLFFFATFFAPDQFGSHLEGLSREHVDFSDEPRSSTFHHCFICGSFLYSRRSVQDKNGVVLLGDGRKRIDVSSNFERAVVL